MEVHTPTVAVLASGVPPSSDTCTREASKAKMAAVIIYNKVQDGGCCDYNSPGRDLRLSPQNSDLDITMFSPHRFG